VGVFSSQGTRRLSLTRSDRDEFSRDAAGPRTEAARKIFGDFVNDVFCELLGYSRAVDNPRRYTIPREKHVQANGKFADAVLGAKDGQHKPRVCSRELKIRSDPLDGRAHGHNALRSQTVQIQRTVMTASPVFHLLHRVHGS
jgi:hypothetical protein